MNATLQLDSYQYKCKCCHKLHSGPTRILDFRCINEQMRENWLERTYEADFTAVCECDEHIKITFMVREYPESNFTYLGYKSSDAEIIIEPKVREHMEMAQF